jgi:hypothetical protein
MIARMCKCSRRAAFNWSTTWISEGKVEAAPSRTGWRRKVRSLGVFHIEEAPSNEASPDGDVILPADVNPYQMVVREYGQRFIEILRELRDNSIDSRVMLAAATCLSEFNCEAPNNDDIEDTPESDHCKDIREAIAWMNSVTEDELTEQIIELEAEVRTQYGDEGVKQCLCYTECRI